MTHSLVIGGGAYGVTCARYALGLDHRCVVVDLDPACRAAEIFGTGGAGAEIEVIAGGIAEALALILSSSPDHIFPTAPVHICAALVAEGTGMAATDIAPLRARIPPDLIVSSGTGSVVVSYNRDGQCLPSCVAPPVCPVTGIHRDVPLFRVLREALPGAAILESVQCAPGIGALSGPEVIGLLERAAHAEQIIVGTACRCHGVVTAMGRKKDADQSILDTV
ncbi:MAG TPA: hypothetical protein ENN52_07265 [Methanofollis liminatans]|uniref:Uncharacterized protein n=1 Tax=Methanofollis liminatans TaxID=2201 RepID=A0A831LW21_9EURY|nr:hypothetical protein [Methanofollis liminatans]